MSDTDKRERDEYLKQKWASATQLGASENSVYTVFRAEDFAGVDTLTLDDGRMEYAKRANLILSERGQRVWICAHANGERTAHLAEPVDWSERALIVAREPVRKESALDVLREYLRVYDDRLKSKMSSLAPDWIERARKVLEGR
jgi:hypothetical protein